MPEGMPDKDLPECLPDRSQTICQIECQIECQKICQKICQIDCQIDMPEDMTDRVSGRMPDRMPEDMPDGMSDRMPEDMSDRMPEDMSDRMPEDMPDRMPEDMPDRMPEDLPDRMPEDLPEDMPEDMPEHIAEDMPGRMPEDMPDRLPEDMPDKMPEDMSDRMLEDLPVTKRINVMVGITRSKVIFVIGQLGSWQVCVQHTNLHVSCSNGANLLWVCSRAHVKLFVPFCAGRQRGWSFGRWRQQDLFSPSVHRRMPSSMRYARRRVLWEHHYLIQITSGKNYHQPKNALTCFSPTRHGSCSHWSCQKIISSWI